MKNLKIIIKLSLILIIFKVKKSLTGKLFNHYDYVTTVLKILELIVHTTCIYCNDQINYHFTRSV